MPNLKVANQRVKEKQPPAKTNKKKGDGDPVGCNDMTKAQYIENAKPNDGPNSKFFAMMNDAWAKIATEAGHVFWDLDTVGPQEIAEDTDTSVGAIQAPYRKKEFVTTLVKGKSEAIYRCALPLPMMHRYYSAMPTVRISLTQVLQHQKENYSVPSALNPVRIALTSGEDIMCRFHMFHHSVFVSSNLFESQDSINVVNHHVIVNNEEGDARD